MSNDGRYDSEGEAAYHSTEALGKRLDQNRKRFDRYRNEQRAFDFVTKALLWILTPVCLVATGYGLATHKPIKPETQLDRIERTLDRIDHAIGTPAEKV